MTIAGNQGQNVYPNPDNYPASSFPQPVPAPDVEAYDAGTLIQVQYSWEWQQVLLAAVTQLKNPATWQGSHDDILTAIDRATDLQFLLQNQVSAEMVPTPYWSDGDNDEQEDTPEDQTWYGMMDESGDFVEDLTFWALRGFVAATTTPAGAILYRTVEPTFKLIYERDGLGGFLKIFIDATLANHISLAGTVSSLGEVTIVMPSDEEIHDLMLVFSED